MSVGSHERRRRSQRVKLSSIYTSKNTFEKVPSCQRNSPLISPLEVKGGKNRTMMKALGVNLKTIFEANKEGESKLA